jgi:hypothetical protein
MRIYIPAITLSKIKTDLIQKYLFKQTQLQFLLSEDGFIQIHGEKLMRLSVSNEIPLQKEKIDHLDILVDKSKWIFDEEWFQIYPSVVEESIDKYVYQIRKGSSVDLVVEKQEGKITDFYFSTKEEDINTNVKDDIRNLLEILNIL